MLLLVGFFLFLVAVYIVVFCVAQGISTFWSMVAEEHNMRFLTLTKSRTFPTIHVNLTRPKSLHPIYLWHSKTWTPFPFASALLRLIYRLVKIYTYIRCWWAWCWTLSIETTSFASFIFLLPHSLLWALCKSLTGNVCSDAFFLISSVCWRQVWAASFILSDREIAHLLGVCLSINAK